MKIIFTALLCAFAVTTGVSGSLSIEAKAVQGEDLSSETEHMRYLVGYVKDTEFLKGFGVFISLRHFLTVAAALIVGYNRNTPEYIKKEDLKLVTGLHDHIVLNYEIHPNSDELHNNNNIAVILVEEHTYFGLLPNGNFPIALPRRYHFKTQLNLFGFEYEEDGHETLLDLKLFSMNLLPKDECEWSFTYFHATEHFCCRAVDALTHSLDIGTPILDGDRIVGLVLYSQDLHIDSLYVNIFYHVPYIEQAKRRLGC